MIFIIIKITFPEGIIHGNVIEIRAVENEKILDILLQIERFCVIHNVKSDDLKIVIERYKD